MQQTFIIAPYVLGTVLNPLNRLSHLILTITLTVRFSYYPGLTQEEIRHGGGKQLAKKRGRPAFQTRLLDSETHALNDSVSLFDDN